MHYFKRKAIFVVKYANFQGEPQEGSVGPQNLYITVYFTPMFNLNDPLFILILYNIILFTITVWL